MPLSKRTSLSRTRYLLSGFELKFLYSLSNQTMYSLSTLAITNGQNPGLSVLIARCVIDVKKKKVLIARFSL